VRWRRNPTGQTQKTGQSLGEEGLTPEGGLSREFLLDARFSAAEAPEDPVDHRSFLFNR